MVSDKNADSFAPRFITWLRRILIPLSVCAFASIVIQHGFYLSHSLESLLKRFDFFVIEYYLFQYLMRLAFNRRRLFFLASHWFETMLAGAILLETFLVVRILGPGRIPHYFFSSVRVTQVTEVYLIVTQTLILLSLIPTIIRYNQRILTIQFHPAHIVLISFAGVIFFGALLLMLPRATVLGESIHAVDALFTATSAICVTGLTVVDTATYFSPLGKFIILVLIQLGGIGIVTLTTFLAMFFGKGMAFRDRMVMRDITNVEQLSLITSTIRSIIITIVCMELAGAVVLGFLWAGQGWSMRRLVFAAVFHSVSAFCNAGFALFSDSLVSFRGNPGVLAVFACLIVTGGLGFRVIEDLFLFLLNRLRGGSRRPLKAQTKLVCAVTAMLIAAGFCGYMLLEAPLNTDSIRADLMSALFTSITARTAGFNTVDTGGLSVPFSLVLIVLMFIGASPGSTGGGIVAIGENFEANLLASVLLKNAGVKRIISRASKPLHIKILTAVGIDEIVNPGIDAADKLVYRLIQRDLIDIIRIDDRISVAKIQAPKQFVGQSIGRLNLRAKYGINVISVNRRPAEGGEAAHETVHSNPGADFVIQQNDILLVIGNPEDMEKLTRD